MARDMYGPMTGASAWMMTLRWDVRHVLLLWMMWAVMMAGMMLPSASPMLLMYGVAARRQGFGADAAPPDLRAGIGIHPWSGRSSASSPRPRSCFLSTRLAISPMMTLTSPRVGASLLIVAGFYQLTPLKRVCLQKCQSPFGFLMHHWRAGVGGAFRMGDRSRRVIASDAAGRSCCCCLSGGVMNLAVIAALTVFVAFEKFGPFGIHRAARQRPAAACRGGVDARPMTLLGPRREQRPIAVR